LFSFKFQCHTRLTDNEVALVDGDAEIIIHNLRFDRIDGHNVILARRTSCSLITFRSVVILSGMKLNGTLALMILMLVAADSKPDAFQAKTVWQGVPDADPRWANTREFPARPTV
jgi:hypothetical protein